VKAVQFDIGDKGFPVSLVDLPEPALPADDWARVDVASGGICGSDLHIFTHETGASPTLATMGRVPFVLGHEIGGTVAESGPDCPLRVGTRVAVDPCIPCAARGVEPCANCARGWTSSCLNLDNRIVSSGRTLGFTQNLGGGWCEQVLAHSSMMHVLPDEITDRGSSLCEPLSIACHGILRAPPKTGEPVLVVGAGIIGLAAVAVLKGLHPDSEITVLARHPHQSAAAIACGAARVVESVPGRQIFEQLGELVGARVVGWKDEVMLMGGFPYVVEAVGAPRTVTDALRAVGHRGTVLLLGVAGISEVDLTPIWYKEVALVGSIDHSVDSGSTPGLGGGAGLHSMDRAIQLLAAGLLPERVVVTHEYPLDSYREAIETAIDRQGSRAIKVVFRP
jgi:L-iditol 2-dehydrogenase